MLSRYAVLNTDYYLTDTPKTLFENSYKNEENTAGNQLCGQNQNLETRLKNLKIRFLKCNFIPSHLSFVESNFEFLHLSKIQFQIYHKL